MSEATLTEPATPTLSAEPQRDGCPGIPAKNNLPNGIDRAFWDRWVDDCGPLELLRRIDLNIRIGRWTSRQEAFLDYAAWALRNIGGNSQQLPWTLRWLAQSLLDQAEEQERLSQQVFVG